MVKVKDLGDAVGHDGEDESMSFELAKVAGNIEIYGFLYDEDPIRYGTPRSRQRPRGRVSFGTCSEHGGREDCAKSRVKFEGCQISKWVPRPLVVDPQFSLGPRV